MFHIVVSCWWFLATVAATAITAAAGAAAIASRAIWSDPAADEVVLPFAVVGGGGVASGRPQVDALLEIEPEVQVEVGEGVERISIGVNPMKNSYIYQKPMNRFHSNNKYLNKNECFFKKTFKKRKRIISFCRSHVHFLKNYKILFYSWTLIKKFKV